MEEHKVPYQIKAAKKKDAKADIDKIAIWPEKGIPIQSPNGKTWLIFVSDDGNIKTAEVVE